MKKKIKYITEYIRLPLSIVLVLLISGSVFSQDKNLVGVQFNSAAYIKACGDYPASGTLVHGSSTLIAGKECSTTISPGSSIVYFTARDLIILSPGFKALNGSKFIARIEPNTLSLQKNVSEAINTKAYLLQNSPNPFSNMTMVRCYIPESAKQARLVVYNVNGQLINSFTLSKGMNNVNVAGGSLAAGQYSYSLIVDGQIAETKNMTIAR